MPTTPSESALIQTRASATRDARIPVRSNASSAPKAAGCWWQPVVLGATLVLGACGGDGLETGGTGGAGGGEDDIPEEPSLVEPFVGVYDITGNWSGIPQVPQDQATLVIRPLNANGSADVTILDFDDGNQNCSFASNVVGTATESLIDGRIFLDQLTDFQQAVLELSGDGSILTLEYTDLNDIDADGDTNEIVTYQATRQAGLTEDDVPLCSRGF